MALVAKDRGGSYFTSYVKQRIERNQNFLCAITGQTGSGKSLSAIKLAEECDTDFDVHNICFSYPEFLALINGKIKKLKKGSHIVFDEIQVSMSHLDYMSIQAKLINYLLQTFRHRCFVLWVTSPHISFINASVRRLFHCRMETLNIDYKNKLCHLKAYLRQINQKSGKIYEKYLRVATKDGVFPVDMVDVGLPSKELEKAYEKKKTEFTNDLNKSIERDLRRLDEDKQKPLTEKQEYILDLLVEGKTLKDVQEKLGIGMPRIYDHIKRIKRKGIKITPVKEENRVLRYNVVGYYKET